MRIRELLGVILFAAAVVIAPLGVNFDHRWWYLALGLAIVGYLLYSSRWTRRRETRDEHVRSASGYNQGDALDMAGGGGNDGAGDADGD